MSAVIRIKYRPTVIHPELQIENENSSLSLAKKVKVVEEDPYSLVSGIKHDETCFLATHTQIKRVEIFVSSDEELYRRKMYPTIQERIVLQKDWAKHQLAEAKVAYEREALKKLMEEKVRTAQVASAAAIKAHVSGSSSPTSPIPGEAEDSLADYPVPEEEEEEEGEEGNQTDVSYAQELTGIKERKLLVTRNTAVYHKEISSYEARKMAFKLYMGWIGKSDKTLTVVLPWLLLGRKETSQNMPLLLKLGVTHILNVTHDLPNRFNNHFVYQRIAVKDNNDADIGSKFSTAITFMKRAETCKGRLLVHCTAGASRAPSIVLAFLVFSKKLSLLDAYTYLTALRPLVAPNKHFLFQLAMLEVQYGEGCSVYFHKEWRFYEFNTFRAVGVEARQSVGLYRTAVKLHTPDQREDDLLPA